MKSPFASLNWGVFQPESGYVLILTKIAASGGMDSETTMYGKNTKIYTTFASAFEQLFQQSAQQMDNRVEWFLENTNQSHILSKLDNFTHWDNYRALTRRTLTDSERNQLNQAFEGFIDLTPSMNLTGIMSFKTEFLDDYYSSETQINIDLLPRNLEGRA